MCDDNCDKTYIDCLHGCGEYDCYSKCATNWDACYKACPCSDDCPGGCEFCDNSACACSVCINTSYVMIKNHSGISIV